MPSQSSSNGHPGNQKPPFFFHYPSFYCQAWCYLVWHTLLVSSGQLTQHPLAHPQPTCWKDRVQKVSLDLVFSNYSAIAKILMCYQQWLRYKFKHSTIWAAMKKVSSIPIRPSMGTGVLLWSSSCLASVAPWRCLLSAGASSGCNFLEDIFQLSFI